MLGGLLTQWTYGRSASPTAFAIPEVETPRWRATLPNKVVDSNRRLDVNTVIRDYVASRVSLRAVRFDQGRARLTVTYPVTGTDAVPAQWT
jgi:hypothetical protein